MKQRFSNTGRILLLLSFAFPLTVPCISLEKNDMESAAVRIMGEAFVKNNGIRILKVLTDEIGPRLTGSEAYRRAAEYCGGVFRTYGLTNVHLESFETPGWLPGQASAETLGSPAKELRVDTLGLSVNTPVEGLAAEIVDVGHGTEQDFERMGPAINGKIVLAGLKDPSDRSEVTRGWRKIQLAAKRGAVACLIISPTKGGVTRMGVSAYYEPAPIPGAAIAYEDGLWLRRRLEDGKPVKIRILIRNKFPGNVRTDNVVAEIKGREKPEEVVILGAHLDTWFTGPGAADNALGVSIAMETARILSLPGLAPKRTIRFILFGGEEEGLLGSFEYAKAHEKELDNVALMVNLDMVGMMSPRVVSPYGACAIGDQLLDLLPILGGLGITQVESRHPFDSDDFCFVANGVPALGIYGNEIRDMNWYHSYADTFDKIEVDKLNLNTAAVATVVHCAASRSEPMGKHLSRTEVIRYFEEKKLTRSLKEDGSWKRLGFPEEKPDKPH